MTGGAYQARPIRFIGRQPVREWRLKVYGIAVAHSHARPALVSATLAKAATALPPEPFEEGRSGVGFVIAHDAAQICFGLVYWWQGSNELHQRLFVAPKERPADLTAIEHPAAGCVWELGVIDFERRAWLADVLANPDGPDVERYMSREFNDEF